MSYATAPAGPHASLIKEFETELLSIADWWTENTIDTVNGGFIGEIDVHGVAKPRANKGSILHARILWFFSDLARFTEREKYRQVADIAYDYLMTRFWDDEYHGIYWEIDYRGNVVNSKKHVYAQSFAIYALCAYHRLTGSDEALAKAVKLYELIETSAHDSDNGGYREAFDRTWSEINNFALNDEEPNFPKTMNTHLHLFEAITALYTVYPNQDVKFSLKRLLDYFTKYFVDPKNFHLRIYFNDEWQDQSTSYSYGHDIECSWLLWEAAETIGDDKLSSVLAPVVLNIASACLDDALGEYGEVLDGYDLKEKRLIDARPWWAQAEALVGFLNAYCMTGEEQYFRAFANVWEFINNYQMDKEIGEWHWFSRLDREKNPYKTGFWKAPYHNGRAMLEVCKRLRHIECVEN